MISQVISQRAPGSRAKIGAEADFISRVAQEARLARRAAAKDSRGPREYCRESEGSDEEHGGQEERFQIRTASIAQGRQEGLGPRLGLLGFEELGFGCVKRIRVQ